MFVLERYIKKMVSKKTPLIYIYIDSYKSVSAWHFTTDIFISIHAMLRR